MINPISKLTELKSAIDKRTKGAVSGEWQILKDNITISKNIMDIIPITSVHTALYDNVDIELDKCISNDFVDHKTSSFHSAKLKEALDVAEKCALYQHNQITVVIHMCNPFLHDYKTLAKYIENLLIQYPHCDLAVENTLLYSLSHEIRPASICGCVQDVVKNVRINLCKINEYRIGTVFDVCHALGTIRIQNSILDDNRTEIEKLEEFYKTNEGLCKIIHFNNARGFGIGPQDHGIIFDNESMLFNKNVDFYQKYIPNADFVIEVQEDDYSDSVNFEKIVKQLKKTE